MPKTREELLSETYLNCTEIRILLKLSQRKARKVWILAMERDREELGDYLIYENKARFKTVMKVSGNDYNLLARQIKNAVSAA